MHAPRPGPSPPPAPCPAPPLEVYRSPWSSSGPWRVVGISILTKESQFNTEKERWKLNGFQKRPHHARHFFDHFFVLS